MNDDHDMTRHLPNAEAMPADFEQTEALPTLVGGVSEQASAVTQALPVEPTQAFPSTGPEAGWAGGADTDAAGCRDRGDAGRKGRGAADRDQVVAG